MCELISKYIHELTIGDLPLVVENIHKSSRPLTRFFNNHSFVFFRTECRGLNFAMPFFNQVLLADHSFKQVAGYALDAFIWALLGDAMTTWIHMSRWLRYSIGPPDSGSVKDDVVLGTVVERSDILVIDHSRKNRYQHFP